MIPQRTLKESHSLRPRPPQGPHPQAPTMTTLIRRMSPSPPSPSFSQFSNKSRQSGTFYTLPPELRAQIFELLLCDWDGKTPLLLKALKPDRKLYDEALKLYYRIMKIKVQLRTWNGWAFQRMSHIGAKTVVALEVEFGYSIITTDGATKRGWNSSMRLGPQLKNHAINKATNVTSICIDTDVFRRSFHILHSRLEFNHQNVAMRHIKTWRPGVRDLVQHFVETFQKLRSLTIIVVPHERNRLVAAMTGVTNETGNLVRDLNSLLRVHAQLKQAPLHSPLGSISHWSWVVGEGEKLRWYETRGEGASLDEEAFGASDHAYNAVQAVGPRFIP